MTEKKTSLPAKLAEVAKECGYVQKKGVNTFHRYKYAMASDVLDKVNTACADHGIAVTTKAELLDWREVTTSKGNKEHLITVSVTLTLYNSENEETMTATALGTGQDPGDKAIAKAQTMAHKYAWMHSLNIATGDDPEADERTDQSTDSNTNSISDKPSEKQVKYMHVLSKQKGVTPDLAKAQLKKQFNKNSSKELTKSEVQQFITWLNNLQDDVETGTDG